MPDVIALHEVAWSFPAAVVLVVDPLKITARQVRKLLDRLHEVNATVAAVLVTSAPERAGGTSTSRSGALFGLRR